MTLDLTFYLFAVPAVIFAGIAKGGFANGPAFAAAPFLALVVPPTQAVALMLPILMVMDVTALRAYWRQWQWNDVKLLLFASVPGILIGALLFRTIDGSFVKLMIGVIAVGFVAFQISVKRGWLKLGRGEPTSASAILWGGLSGFSSFVSHAGGPPASVYLLRRNLDKTTFQACSVLFFSVVNALKFFVYLGMGLFTTDTVWAVATLVPCAIAGTLAGVWAHKHVPETLFFNLAYIFLTLTGLKLIWDALI
ncbi:sulfite exporter TauE/SafE family protein [Algicella marina]|uniref:Probable membrane transporter protein n=1 Tax=Algicella marina TaxID=2683284 RepID=A0A6P1T3H4_9RHOB|nr:sulfite exporter TauE/SafE family protein [Algicella marina]QHQ36270.1 TSUP family transporter [Algicella marina]